jgi:hypothetical protein
VHSASQSVGWKQPWRGVPAGRGGACGGGWGWSQGPSYRRQLFLLLSGLVLRAQGGGRGCRCPRGARVLRERAAANDTPPSSVATTCPAGPDRTHRALGQQHAGRPHACLKRQDKNKAHRCGASHWLSPWLRYNSTRAFTRPASSLPERQTSGRELPHARVTTRPVRKHAPPPADDSPSACNSSAKRCISARTETARRRLQTQAADVEPSTNPPQVPGGVSGGGEGFRVRKRPPGAAPRT